MNEGQHQQIFITYPIEPNTPNNLPSHPPTSTSGAMNENNHSNTNTNSNRNVTVIEFPSNLPPLSPSGGGNSGGIIGAVGRSLRFRRHSGTSNGSVSSNHSAGVGGVGVGTSSSNNNNYISSNSSTRSSPVGGGGGRFLFQRSRSQTNVHGVDESVSSSPITSSPRSLVLLGSKIGKPPLTTSATTATTATTNEKTGMMMKEFSVGGSTGGIDSEVIPCHVEDAVQHGEKEQRSSRFGSGSSSSSVGGGGSNPRERQPQQQQRRSGSYNSELLLEAFKGGVEGDVEGGGNQLVTDYNPLEPPFSPSKQKEKLQQNRRTLSASNFPPIAIGALNITDDIPIISNQTKNHNNGNNSIENRGDTILQNEIVMNNSANRDIHFVAEDDDPDDDDPNDDDEVDIDDKVIEDAQEGATINKEVEEVVVGTEEDFDDDNDEIDRRDGVRSYHKNYSNRSLYGQQAETTGNQDADGSNMNALNNISSSTYQYQQQLQQQQPYQRASEIGNVEVGNRSDGHDAEMRYYERPNQQPYENNNHHRSYNNTENYAVNDDNNIMSITNNNSSMNNDPDRRGRNDVNNYPRPDIVPINTNSSNPVRATISPTKQFINDDDGGGSYRYQQHRNHQIAPKQMQQQHPDMQQQMQYHQSYNEMNHYSQSQASGTSFISLEEGELVFHHRNDNNEISQRSINNNYEGDRGIDQRNKYNNSNAITATANSSTTTTRSGAGNSDRINYSNNNYGGNNIRNNNMNYSNMDNSKNSIIIENNEDQQDLNEYELSDENTDYVVVTNDDDVPSANSTGGIEEYFHESVALMIVPEEEEGEEDDDYHDNGGVVAATAAANGTNVHNYDKMNSIDSDMYFFNEFDDGADDDDGDEDCDDGDDDDNKNQIFPHWTEYSYLEGSFHDYRLNGSDNQGFGCDVSFNFVDVTNLIPKKRQAKFPRWIVQYVQQYEREQQEIFRLELQKYEQEHEEQQQQDGNVSDKHNNDQQHLQPLPEQQPDAAMTPVEPDARLYPSTRQIENAAPPIDVDMLLLKHANPGTKTRMPSSSLTGIRDITTSSGTPLARTGVLVPPTSTGPILTNPNRTTINPMQQQQAVQSTAILTRPGATQHYHNTSGGASTSTDPARTKANLVETQQRYLLAARAAAATAASATSTSPPGFLQNDMSDKRSVRSLDNSIDDNTVNSGDGSFANSRSFDNYNTSGATRGRNNSIRHLEPQNLRNTSTLAQSTRPIPMHSNDERIVPLEAPSSSVPSTRMTGSEREQISRGQGSFGSMNGIDEPNETANGEYSDPGRRLNINTSSLQQQYSQRDLVMDNNRLMSVRDLSSRSTVPRQSAGNNPNNLSSNEYGYSNNDYRSNYNSSVAGASSLSGLHQGSRHPSNLGSTSMDSEWYPNNRNSVTNARDPYQQELSNNPYGGAGSGHRSPPSHRTTFVPNHSMASDNYGYSDNSTPGSSYSGSSMYHRGQDNNYGGSRGGGPVSHPDRSNLRYHQAQQQHQQPPADRYLGAVGGGRSNNSDYHPATTSRPTTNPPNMMQIEVMPGVYENLRGAQETMQAVEDNNIAYTSCMVCTLELVCVSDSQYVLCPECKVVSALMDRYGRTIGREGGGVGLGIHASSVISNSHSNINNNSSINGSNSSYDGSGSQMYNNSNNFRPTYGMR